MKHTHHTYKHKKHLVEYNIQFVASLFIELDFDPPFSCAMICNAEIKSFECINQLKQIYSYVNLHTPHNNTTHTNNAHT